MKRLIIVALSAFSLAACGSEDTAETLNDDMTRAAAPVAETPEDLQVVRVTVEGSAYLFSPSSVRAGHPVRLVFDPAGLPGCSRDVTLPDFDIAKVIAPGNETIEFTPEDPGTIAVACSMNMYRGTLVAE